MRTLPGVRHASFALFAPLGDRGDQMRVRAEGEAEADADALALGYNFVWHGFFDVLRLPVLRGRDVTLRDDVRSAPVAIVNEAFARRKWPGLDPLGRRVVVSQRDGEERVHEVIGVVRDGHPHGRWSPPWRADASARGTTLVLHGGRGGNRERRRVCRGTAAGGSLVWHRSSRSFNLHVCAGPADGRRRLASLLPARAMLSSDAVALLRHE